MQDQTGRALLQGYGQTLGIQTIVNTIFEHIDTQINTSKLNFELSYNTCSDYLDKRLQADKALAEERTVEKLFGPIPEEAQRVQSQIFDYFRLHQAVPFCRWNFIIAGCWGLDVHPLDCLACQKPIEEPESGLWHCDDHLDGALTKREELVALGKGFEIESAVKQVIDNVQYKVFEFEEKAHKEKQQKSTAEYKARKAAERENGISSSDDDLFSE